MHALIILLCVSPILLVRRRLIRSDSIPLLHPLSALTSLPILISTLRSNRNATIHAAHLKHGPIVRLSPTEVSVSDPAILKTIYTSFPKSSWYTIFYNYSIAPMFAILPGKEHAARRKLLATAYSNSTVSKSKVLRQVAVEALPVLLQSFEGTEEKEIWRKFNRLTVDFITAFVFGRDVGTRFVEEASEPELLTLYYSRRPYFEFSSQLPGLVRWLDWMTLGKMNLIPSWVNNADSRIEEWCLRLCSRRGEAWGNNEVLDEPCVLDRLLAAEANLSEIELASEMLDHIGAGHETSALALSFTLAALSRRPELQLELGESLQPLLEKRDGWWLPRLGDEGYKSLESHPLLNAVLKESLRLYAPIPGSQPRVAPRDMEILGHFIPAGTVISAQAHTLHHDPKIWGEDVEEFRPERWLEGGGELERAWWPFGSGGRGCIGRWLAMWELRVVVAAMVGNFEVLPDKDVVEGIDAYTTAPVGGGVWVGFRKWEDAV